MADVKLDLDDGAKLLLSQLRRDPPGMPTDNRIIQSFKNTGIPYLAISAIGNALAGATIRVKIRKERDDIPPGTSMVVKSSSANQQHKDEDLIDAPSSHPLCRLFDYINPNDTFEDLMMDCTLQYHLTGTSPFWFVPSLLGPPCEMYVLPTALMLAQPMSPQYPEGSWLIQQYFPAGAFGMIPTQNTGSGVRVDGRQIKRFRMRHPIWRWDGYSPLTAGGVQLDVLNAIDESRKSAMDHGFNPDAVITVAGANEQSLLRLKTDMENRHGGSRNARKVLFSNGQSLDVETLSTNPKEMDYGAGWDQMVKYALALFGVPPGTAGIAEATSYAQLYASLEQFYSLRMAPLAKWLGSFFTKHVAKDVDPNAVIQIDVPKIQDKEFEKGKWADAAQYGLVTINEWRGAMLSMEPMEDGDRPIGSPSAEEKAMQQQQEQQEAAQPQTPEDAVTGSVLGMLGVDPNEADGDGEGQPQPDVEKAMVNGKWEEQKHPRSHGKFAHTNGGSGGMRKPVGTMAKVVGARQGPAVSRKVGDMHVTPGMDAKLGIKPNAKVVSGANPDLVGDMQSLNRYGKHPAVAMMTRDVDNAARAVFGPVAGLIDHFNKLDDTLSDVGAWAKRILFPPKAVDTVKQQIRATGQDASHLTQSKDWAVNAAKKYSTIVGRKLGKDPRKCERALFHMFTKMAEMAAGSGQTSVAKVRGVGTFRMKPKDTGKPYPSQKPGGTQRADLAALFKSGASVAEILKAL